jgi:hypothetical protein
MSYLRFTDRTDKQGFIKNSSDFLFREHGMPNIQVLYLLFVLMLGTFFLVLNFALFLLSPESLFDIKNEKMLMYTFGIAVLLIVMMFFSFTISKRIKGLLLETEFLNLLFANGMRLGTDFCQVIHSSGKSVYYDKNFIDAFGINAGQDAYSVFLSKAGLAESDKSKVNNAVENCSEVSVENQGYKINISPISRPKGFVVLSAVKK